ncbi:DUF1800 domain-containing protein [Paeniroseomonas aquatica]|uniref:DUF1800 domain-containing protein n=1 Tax=Paeniroseomonas aquatica TaxID=373043 RepID=A0ABT8A9L6_9PROT|nr:DUF1800 domain-containing protein [Paeniroseomonas aquatica]MDN3566436.1 DUF1800 domain-containing protein [Paeniroseomonas aquatica]
MIQAAPIAEAGARRFLARAAYGACPGEAAALARHGIPAWLDRQLALPAEEPALEARIDGLLIPIRYAPGPGEQFTDERRPPVTLRQSQAERWPLADQRPGYRMPAAERDRPRLELTLVTLLRKTAAEAQLRERLVEFWHDHFSLAFQADSRVAVSLPEHDRRIRAHALGSFRALLEAMATSPAMLVYLNNHSSRAGAPNENYARELLELHTLGQAAYRGSARSGRDVPQLPDGRPAFYVDADVWEAARALTGWSIAAGQAFDGLRTLPRTGEFAYVAAWHDPYQKRFLGRDLDPFAPAMAHGRAVLDALAEHPATARFLCTKLARFLLGDPVPAAAVARAETAFRRHAARDDQIAQAVRALLAGPEALDPAPARIRRPLDVVAAAARALALPFTPTPGLIGQMALAGQLPFGWGPPDGQPLDPEGYLGATALRARWGMAIALARNSGGTGLSPLYAPLAQTPVAEVAARLAEAALGPAGAAVGAAVAGVWTAAGRSARPGPAEVAELAGWVLTAPAFQTA